MYMVGGPHPHKVHARLLIELLIGNRERLVTDAEVLQEILHRYQAIGRVEAIDPALGWLLQTVDEVYPVERNDVIRASKLLKQSKEFSARDALHLAIMEKHNINRILSFDSDFDRWPGIERLHQV